MIVLNPNIAVQLISCTIGCTFFAIMFKIKGGQVIYSGIGAFLCWATYLAVFNNTSDSFVSNTVAAMVVAAYANIMARVNKAPMTIFLTASSFPLIPGARLYYMMYSIVMENSELAREHARALVVTCLGIAVGFLVVEVINKYLNLGLKYLKAGVKAVEEKRG